MNLVVDIGNTFIKWALVAAQRGDGTSLPEVTPGEAVASQVGADALIERVAREGRPDRVIYASVSSVETSRELEAGARRVWDAKVQRVETAAYAHGLVNKYLNPTQMGVDRWVAAVAAHRLMPNQDVTVVDCGTAITIDTVTGNGQLLGGLILPGAALARRALLDRTERIDESVDASIKGLAPFGVSTAQCVHQGSRFAAVGAVLLALEHIEQHLGRKPQVVICGGGADMIAQHLEPATMMEPHLVLRGLAMLGDVYE